MCIYTYCGKRRKHNARRRDAGSLKAEESPIPGYLQRAPQLSAGQLESLRAELLSAGRPVKRPSVRSGKPAAKTTRAKIAPCR